MRHSSQKNGHGNVSDCEKQRVHTYKVSDFTLLTRHWGTGNYLDRSNDSPFSAGPSTISIGRWAVFKTLLATLPMTRCFTPVRPWVPTTIKSTDSSCAKATISSGRYASSTIDLHILGQLSLLRHQLKALIAGLSGFLKEFQQFLGPIDIAGKIDHMEDEKLCSKSFRVVHRQFPRRGGCSPKNQCKRESSLEPWRTPPSD